MEISIAGRKIGDGHPLFFIAEAGVNHNGSLELGKKLVDVAKSAGADAVKFQTFKAEEVSTETAPKSSYHIKTTGRDEEQTWFQLLKTQEISLKMHKDLIAYCREKEILFLSTPYGKESADLLESLEVPAFKIASTDTNNIPFLRYVARKGMPMILSTAMCTMEEVESAVEAVRAEGLNEIVVLQCTGNYPSRLESSNLRVIHTFRKNMKCLVGYSDHNLRMINPVAATALGACVYEKHVTIDKNLPGPDHRASQDPQELKDTVEAIRQTEIALGIPEKSLQSEEEENRLKLRKSLVAEMEIPKGTIITKEMISIKRPGFGIPPKNLDSIIGKCTIRLIENDSLIDYQDLE